MLRFKVLFYSTDVFKNVGMSLKTAQAATTGVGAVSVVMTAIVVSFMISLISND